MTRIRKEPNRNWSKEEKLKKIQKDTQAERSKELDYYNQKRNNQEHNYKIKNW